MQALKEANSLSEATEILRKDGYTDTAEFQNKQLLLNDKPFKVDQLKLRHTVRFEGMSNPADNTILYAIESVDGNHKGLLIDSYGAKSSRLIAETIKKIENHD